MRNNHAVSMNLEDSGALYLVKYEIKPCVVSQDKVTAYHASAIGHSDLVLSDKLLGPLGYHITRHSVMAAVNLWFSTTDKWGEYVCKCHGDLE